jgi:hypothetical protein
MPIERIGLTSARPQSQFRRFVLKRFRVFQQPVRTVVGMDAELEAIFAKRTAPRERNEDAERMERTAQRRQCVQNARETKRLEDWKKWREELLANPETAFSSEKRDTTFADIYIWLRAWSKRTNRYDVWDKAALTQVFGADVAARAERAFRAYWRTASPALWATRPAQERHITPNSWLYGLCGVSAEASSPGWAAALSLGDAETAIAFATIEINGFAPFITDLVASHPTEVEAVIGDETIAELALGADNGHLPAPQDLTYAEPALKQLLAPRLSGALIEWPSTFTEEAGPRLAHHLDQILRILGGTIAYADRPRAAQECADRYVADSDGPLALAWLRGLFSLNAELGTQTLTTRLARSGDAGLQVRALTTFANLFGNRDAELLVFPEPSQRAQALGQLVRYAYTFVRREDDEEHEDVYTPGTRDKAETARDFLLSALLDTPGVEARDVLLELADEPIFAHIPDRLRLKARQRAAADAEFTAYDPQDLVILESRYEAPPHDRDGLFTVMMDRLDDLAHNVAHYDFTDRRTLRTITDEVEMQRTLSWRLADKSNGSFVLTREDEVADLKRTDIRFSAVRGDQKAVAEVKIADTRWSLADLELALRNQLVGQYLRHAFCKAGCLLLTYDGRKKYWIHPQTRRHMNFPQVVAYLHEKAQQLAKEMHDEVRLAVFGLDLTDPPLAPAHRGK